MPLSVSRKKASDVDGYRPIDLSGLCNGGLKLLTGHREPPVGDQVFHGLPFRIGNRGDTSAPCFVVLEAGQDVTVPVGKTADHIVVAHRRLRAKDGGARARSVRAGRTFLTAGPIIDLRAEGCQMGDTLQISGPGTIHISARAESIFPIWTLQILQNGRVVAEAREPDGARSIELDADLRVEGHCWLAARCAGPGYWDSPSHLGPWPRGIFAHASPIYVACGGGEWSQFDVGHAQAMRALIEGGLQRVRGGAVTYPEDRILHHHGETDHTAFLERPFLEALRRVRERLEQARSQRWEDDR
jgi:hypothetical protein